MARGLEWDVTPKFLWELFLKQDKKCALTDIEIIFPLSYKSSEQTASLDRIDSKQGYIETNVQWLHKDLNNIKQDYTQEEFINYCRLVVKKYG